jgi:hypothetical protein
MAVVSCTLAFCLDVACPGSQSSSAGKVSACQGCPNQKICASGKPSAPDPGLDFCMQTSA